MEDKTTFTFTGRIRSIRDALEGIITILRTQHNAWVHAAATILVVVAGIVFNVSALEWCWLIVAVVMVWVAEALNTAIELLCDVAFPDFHPVVKKAKNVAAGSVLVAAIGAVLIGLIVLGPYVVKVLKVY